VAACPFDFPTSTFGHNHPPIDKLTAVTYTSMPPTAMHMVKVQDLGPSKGTNIHKIFSEVCGEMHVYPTSDSISFFASSSLSPDFFRRNVYRDTTDKPNSTTVVQCFIEFVDHDSIERACKLRVDDILVQPMSPSLMDEYRSIVAEAITPERPSRVQSDAITTITEESSHPPPALMSVDDNDATIVPSLDSNRKLSNKPARRSRLQTEEIDAMILDCSRALYPAPPSSTVPAHQLPSPGPSSRERTFLDALKSSKGSLFGRLHGRHEKENVLLEPPPAELFLPLTPLSVSRPPIPLPAIASLEPSNQRPSASSFTLNTRLVMTLCDEPISYDLETLEDDPTAIMDLLKATSSERDKWMVVGCHYRRKGNFKAAILVVRTMVQGNVFIPRS
jgi:hypothetical protein